MSLPNSRSVLYQEQICVGEINRISERFRAAGADYIADFVANLEEDGTSLPFLALENIVLFLRSTSNRVDHLSNLVDVIAAVMMLVHSLSLINAQSSSDIINAVQSDLVVLVNRILVYSSPDAVKAAAREVVSVIILAVIDDLVFNQFFWCKPELCFCVFQGLSSARTQFLVQCECITGSVTQQGLISDFKVAILPLYVQAKASHTYGFSGTSSKCDF